MIVSVPIVVWAYLLGFSSGFDSFGLEFGGEVSEAFGKTHYGPSECLEQTHDALPNERKNRCKYTTDHIAHCYI